MIDTDEKAVADETADQAVPPIADTRGILKPIRQFIVFVLGMSVLVVGIAMIILPGPATVVIPAGLAILATEFAWAGRWLIYLKRRAQDVADWSSRKAEARTLTAKDVVTSERVNEPTN